MKVFQIIVLLLIICVSSLSLKETWAQPVTRGAEATGFQSDTPFGPIHEEVYSPHQTFLDAHQGVLPPTREQKFPSRKLSVTDLKKGPTVYGFLPYWEIDYEGFQWDVLTHIAYFCAVLKPDGTFEDTHHWLKSSVSALIAEAHAHDVQVVLTITNFESSEIATLCNDPVIREITIAAILELVQAAGGDGVNIDFEFVPVSAKEGFVLFMSGLTEAFHEAIPGSHVSYAGPCVDWNGSYDYDELKLACDAVFIMGYCYHPHANIPGPLAPVEGGDVWWSKHLTSTIEEYLEWGGDAIESTMIMGLPTYGYDWVVEGPEIPGVVKESGDLVFASDESELGEENPWQIEPASLSSYQVYQDLEGEWHQVWVDTAESHRSKFELSCDFELGGVGFWALGYDGGEGPLWDVLRAELEACSEEVEEPDTVDAIEGDVDTWVDANVPPSEEDTDSALAGKTDTDDGEEGEGDSVPTSSDETSSEEGSSGEGSSGGGSSGGGSSGGGFTVSSGDPWTDEAEFSEENSAVGPSLIPELRVEADGCKSQTSGKLGFLVLLSALFMTFRVKMFSRFEKCIRIESWRMDV